MYVVLSVVVYVERARINALNLESKYLPTFHTFIAIWMVTKIDLTISIKISIKIIINIIIKMVATSQTNGPPPSPLHASFPSSPPAQTKPCFALISSQIIFTSSFIICTKKLVLRLIGF